MASSIDIESKDQKIARLNHKLEVALRILDSWKNECARLQREKYASAISLPPLDALQSRLPPIRSFLKTAEARSSMVSGHGRKTSVIPSVASARSYRSTPIYPQAHALAYHEQHTRTGYSVTDSVEHNKFYVGNANRGPEHVPSEPEPAYPRAVRYATVYDQAHASPYDAQHEPTPEDVVESIERPDLAGNYTDGSRDFGHSGPDSFPDAEGSSETMLDEDSTEESTLGSESGYEAEDDKGPEQGLGVQRMQEGPRPGEAGIRASEAVNRKRDAARAGLDTEEGDDESEDGDYDELVKTVKVLGYFVSLGDKGLQLL